MYLMLCEQSHVKLRFGGGANRALRALNRSSPLTLRNVLRIDVCCKIPSQFVEFWGAGLSTFELSSCKLRFIGRWNIGNSERPIDTRASLATDAMHVFAVRGRRKCSYMASSAEYTVVGEVMR